MQKQGHYDKINNRFYIRILKGFLIGFSLLIPGVCSALLSMALNEYQTLLEVIENFYKMSKVKKHIFFIIGIILGIITVIFGMAYLFKEYQALLELFFLGLAIGGAIKLSKIIRDIKIVDFLVIIVGIFFSLIPEIFNQSTNIQTLTNNTSLLFIIIGGILSSLAFIMPGISGSMILLSLGIYPLIITSFSNCLKIFIKTPDINSIVISVSFFISFVLGALLFSKLINKIISKYESLFMKFCLGLLIGSIIIILINVLYFELSIVMKILIILMGIIVMKIF